MTNIRNWIKFFKDKNGKIILWQSPNLALGLWLVCLILARLLPSGNLKDLVVWLGFGSIVTWSILEIFWGVNYFRRTVGLIVLALVIHNRL